MKKKITKTLKPKGASKSVKKSYMLELILLVALVAIICLIIIFLSCPYCK